MEKITKTAFAFLVLAVLVFAVCGCAQQAEKQKGQETSLGFEPVPMLTAIARVVDGDTLVTAGGERVRLIGINSTEKGEGCYAEAKERLAELLEGKNARLEFDEELRDAYGRLLAYVYDDSNRFVNLIMVREGFAYAYPYKPNTEFAEQFALAEGLAKERGAGCLWKKG